MSNYKAVCLRRLPNGDFPSRIGEPTEGFRVVFSGATEAAVRTKARQWAKGDEIKYCAHRATLRSPPVHIVLLNVAPGRDRIIL